MRIKVSYQTLQREIEPGVTLAEKLLRKGYSRFIRPGPLARLLVQNENQALLRILGEETHKKGRCPLNVEDVENLRNELEKQTHQAYQNREGSFTLLDQDALKTGRLKMAPGLDVVFPRMEKLLGSLPPKAPSRLLDESLAKVSDMGDTAGKCLRELVAGEGTRGMEISV